MRWTAFVVALLTLLARSPAQELRSNPAFIYSTNQTSVYLTQGRGVSPVPSANELRHELSKSIDEILDGPWLPLYSDYSAGEAGGVGLAEWSFTRPGEYLLVLAQAAPYLGAEQRTKARHLVEELIRNVPPTRSLSLPLMRGKPRSLRRTPAVPEAAPKKNETAPLLFAEAYAIWACANAFGNWTEVQPLFEDLRRLRRELEFVPTYKAPEPGVLTEVDLKDPEYCFKVYQSLLAGFHDDYGYHGAREARAWMQPAKPVFFYIQTLSALIGYYRLATHWSDAAEADWARRIFEQVATRALQDRAAPFLWSDPSLCPEVARLLTAAAGQWLQHLAKTPNMALMPARDWDNRPVPGRGDYQVTNPYTWFQAWGGQGEGVRPRTVMGAFLVNAYLFARPASEVADTLDVPWCKADLFYAGKLIVAIGAAEHAPWQTVSL